MEATLSDFIPCIVLAAAMALAVAACGGNDDDKGAMETATAPPTTGAGTPAIQPNTPELTANETVPGGIETAAWSAETGSSA